MSQKVVVITGASRGLGLGMVQYFANKGWKVAATMRTPEKVPSLDGMTDVKKYRLDVMDEDSILTARDQIMEDFGRVDALINNAGMGLFGLTEMVPAEDVQTQIETNLMGGINVTRTFLPIMRQQQSGAVVFITSILGHVAIPLGGFYSATKWALEGYAESLSYELRVQGIRVRTVAPGAYATEFADVANRSVVAPNEVLESFAQRVNEAMSNSQYFGNPEDVPPVVFRAVMDPKQRFRRYLVGKDAKAFFWVRRLLGQRIQHWVARRYLNID